VYRGTTPIGGFVSQDQLDTLIVPNPQIQASSVAVGAIARATSGREWSDATGTWLPSSERSGAL
jgi:hypothetical protein